MGPAATVKVAAVAGTTDVNVNTNDFLTDVYTSPLGTFSSDNETFFTPTYDTMFETSPTVPLLRLMLLDRYGTVKSDNSPRVAYATGDQWLTLDLPFSYGGVDIALDAGDVIVLDDYINQSDPNLEFIQETWWTDAFGFIYGADLGRKYE